MLEDILAKLRVTKEDTWKRADRILGVAAEIGQ